MTTELPSQAPTCPNTTLCNALYGLSRNCWWSPGGGVQVPDVPVEACAVLAAFPRHHRTLSKTYSVTPTIGTDLGISRGTVASSINFSKSNSASVTAACTSPKFSSNRQVYKAYAQGTWKYYKVTKKTYVHGMLAKTKTSRTLSAFNPTGVKCVMRQR
ncbi:hypothetical protein ACYSUO_23355 [Streptomyces sp. UC4497]